MDFDEAFPPKFQSMRIHVLTVIQYDPFSLIYLLVFSKNFPYDVWVFFQDRSCYGCCLAVTPVSQRPLITPFNKMFPNSVSERNPADPMQSNPIHSHALREDNLHSKISTTCTKARLIKYCNIVILSAGGAL